MGYIRDRNEELTGYQESVPFRPSIDLGCDFVMVYGTDDDMPQRVQGYRERGYVVHLMTGIAWGEYQDYLNGDWDGRSHWDEAQMDRFGAQIIHNPTIPYMTPTISFTNYLVERLKVAVDSGVKALHLEEPEFWHNGGYSEAFKREYAIYYRQPWQPPHETLESRYRASKLMAYLYTRAINRISAELKEYAMVRYGRDMPFYVPTHSLLNYTQWKIMSPEAALMDIPTVDGCIAQVWTGTSRSANVYAGVYKERVFETAYLEYGIMQELVRGTGRRMWFLHDPIEDRPQYRWENYRYNYLKTVVASFLHPDVHHYEICPWPHRVFDGIYPRVQPNIESKDETSYPAEDGKPIPSAYSTLLSSIIQLCGDMKQADIQFAGENPEVGVFMSDSGMYQRTYPDGIVLHGLGDRLEVLKNTNDQPDISEEDSARLMKEIDTSDELLYDFIQSAAYPNIYGLSLPLLKYGLPIRPIQLDNISRFAGYLNAHRYLILSYEMLKPASPDINATLASWVRQGGVLIYVGDGKDPFHQINGFWRDAGYSSPAEHLFEMCGLPASIDEGNYSVGHGRIYVRKQSPAQICLNADYADGYREHIKAILHKHGDNWQYRNYLLLHRGPYVIAAVMDESIDETPLTLRGQFADLLKKDYPIIQEKSVAPDGNSILFDLAWITDEQLCVIGSSARLLSLKSDTDGFTVEALAADRIECYIRIRLPKEAIAVTAYQENNEKVEISFVWDAASQTVLLQYKSVNRKISICGRYKEESK